MANSEKPDRQEAYELFQESFRQYRKNGDSYEEARKKAKADMIEEADLTQADLNKMDFDSLVESKMEAHQQRTAAQRKALHELLSGQGTPKEVPHGSVEDKEFIAEIFTYLDTAFQGEYRPSTKEMDVLARDFIGKGGAIFKTGQWPLLETYISNQVNPAETGIEGKKKVVRDEMDKVIRGMYQQMNETDKEPIYMRQRAA